MCTNDSYLKVKNTAKSCKLLTTSSKMDIIICLKNTLANNVITTLKNYFQSYGDIQGVGSHFPVSTALYLRDYVVGLLSLACIPNIAVVVDMANIVANTQQVPEKTMQSIMVKVTRKGIFSIHSMAGWH